MVKLTQATVDKFNGEDVREYTWSTESGFSVTALSYGAIVKSIKVPGSKGAVADVVLGFDNFQEYLEKNARYFGAAIGRCANRIKAGTFELDGATYNLAKNNNGTNHLHGGVKGFDKVNWKSEAVGNKVIFSYLAKDGEEGYPGDLITNITYEVTDDGTFHIDYKAVTTKTTVVNLTNHSYFNLAGHDAGGEGLYDHLVTINADKVTETKTLIPTGNFKQVGGTPYDLRVARSISDVMQEWPALFDDNFCVTNYNNKDLTFVSRVVHPPSGRYMEVYSNQPGVQFYTSNFLPSDDAPSIVGKGGYGYRRHAAFCLETQNYPNAINQTNFPSPILKPGEVYNHQVQYKFGQTQNNA